MHHQCFEDSRSTFKTKNIPLQNPQILIRKTLLLLPLLLNKLINISYKRDFFLSLNLLIDDFWTVMMIMGASKAETHTRTKISKVS